jgi:hypothetical protein
MPNLNVSDDDMPRMPVRPMMPGDSGGGFKKILIVVVVIAVLGGGGYYLYTTFIAKKPAPPPVVVIPPVQEMDTAPLPEVQPPKPEPPPEPTMKPMGTGNYTVVIHSFLSKSMADEEAARWTSAGFPAMVTEKDVGGSMWYRVSVGRYETEQMASRAGREMEPMLENGYWVVRLQ